jgi:hypothetical protein
MLHQQPLVVPSAHAGFPAQHRCLDAALVVLAFLLSGCTTTQDLEQHRAKLRSLASTSVAISEAWLDSDVSRTYARTAFRQTYDLVAQERAAIAASPPTMIDPDGQRLSETSEHLLRSLAGLIDRVSAGDAGAVRRALKDIQPILAESR